MASISYTKKIPSLLDELDLQDLLDELSDFLLSSGYGDPTQPASPRDVQSLKEAIAQKLWERGSVPEALILEWLRDPTSGDGRRFDALLDELIRRLIEEGWIQVSPDGDSRTETGEGGASGAATSARFEISDRGLDFLGFRALRHLLGTLGKSSLGHHDTSHLATGVEASEASKAYEFGDTLNLDIAGTLLRAISRGGLEAFKSIDYSDLLVHQSRYQSSCATVVLLDTSHSMILYGEDRFTPAKRVALALAHMIRTQYPGDSLRLVLFHDTAEEIPLHRLAHVVVGPHHTNTREGLRLARRILAAERKDMRQIIMITDGKPSAMTLDTGQVYKNAFGLDPTIVDETLREVAACRRSGIIINTFMLASDAQLVTFVKKVTEIARGKAYFTTTQTLGQYVLMDYLRKRTERVH